MKLATVTCTIYLLFYAADNNDLSIIKALLAAGADPSKENLTGQTPLDIAKSKGQKNIVRILTDADKGLQQKTTKQYLYVDKTSGTFWSRTSDLQRLQKILDETSGLGGKSTHGKDKSKVSYPVTIKSFAGMI